MAAGDLLWEEQHQGVAGGVAVEGQEATTGGGGGAVPRRSGGGGDHLSATGVPARRSAWDECAFDRKLSFIGFVLHSATQVVSLLSWSTLPLSEKSQRVGSIFFSASIWLLPTLAPALYMRWRKEVLILYRIGFFAFPLLRKARGIQHVMDEPAQPGARGAVKDLTKIIWGSRMMAVVLAVILNPLPMVPLVPHLLVQIYTVLMVRSNGTLCSTPLLTHPLTVRRIHSFHSVLHLTALALPGGVGQSMFPLLDHAPRPEEAECETFLSFLFFLVGLLLPIWVLVKTEPPSSLKDWERRQAAGPRAQAQRGLLGRLEATAEGALRQLCGRSWLAPPEAAEQEREEVLWAAPGMVPMGQYKRTHRLQSWERGFVWWLVIAVLWALCVAAAVPAV